MFIEERHKTILDIVNKNKRILISDIEKRFNISAASARRDLRILEKEGLLVRTYGGAVASDIKYGITEQKADHTPEKNKLVFDNYLQIALKACQYIQEGDCVFLTSGSIGYLMACNIPTDICFTIITNSIIVAEKLYSKENIEVIICGGKISLKGTVHDSFAINLIEKVNFDKAFLTSAAISSVHGATLQKTIGMDIMRSVMTQSKTIIGLYPNEKINQETTFKVCDVIDFDVILTDALCDQTFINECKNCGTDIVIV